MHTTVKYSVLPQNQDGGVPSKFALPKISRFKCAGVIFVSVTALIFIAVSCLRWNVFDRSAVCNLSPPKPSTMAVTHEKEHLRFGHTKRRLPQCLIIGARKAGTRALLNYLNIHPEIVVRGAEPHFFDDEDFDDLNPDYDGYRKKMPYSYEGQVTIEKTPAYFTDSNSPMRVYRMNQTIKLLLILRDPVARAHSDYLQIAEGMKLKNKEVPSFESNCYDKSGRINKSYKAISRSVYHRHLSRWIHSLFSLDQIHIIDSDDLIKDPYHTVRKVEEFLGLEHKIQPDNFYFNETKRFFCIQTESTQKCLADSKGRVHPEINPVVLHDLRQFFYVHNQKLFKMIGRRFNWPGPEE